MANFRFRDDARVWFADVKTKYDFDLFYNCLIVGLAVGRQSEPKAVTSTDMVGHFIESYKPAQSLIIGLLIMAELKFAGINLNERNEVRSVIGDLVTPKSVTNLTDKGVHCLNLYASSGFEFLRDNMPKPSSIENFMLRYTEIMSSIEVPMT